MAKHETSEGDAPRTDDPPTSKPVLGHSLAAAAVCAATAAAVVLIAIFGQPW